MKARVASTAVAVLLGASHAMAEGALPPPPPPPPGAITHDWTGAPPASPPPAPANPAPVLEPVPADVAPPRPGRHWYGYQTLIVDAASGVLVLSQLGVESSNAGPVILGGIAYGFGAPLVHAIHGHSRKFWGSFGLRLGAPVGLGLTAEAMCSSSDRQSCAVAGLLIGMVAASVIDATAIATEDVPPPTLAVAPVLGRDRAGIALSGTF